MLGPSKYSAEIEEIQTKTNAELVLLMVVNGDRGNGIGCIGLPGLIEKIPTLLRDYADRLEREGGMMMADSPAGVSGGKVPPRRKL